MTYQNNNNNNNTRSGQFWCDYHQSNGSHATHDCYVLQRRKNQKNQRNNGGGKRKANNVTEDANEDHEDSLNLVYEQFQRVEDYNNYDNEDCDDEDACLMVNEVLDGNQNINNSEIIITIDSGASRFYVKDNKLFDKLNINTKKNLNM